MSEEMGGMASHIGGAGGAAALVAFFSRWFHSREQQRLETTLALLVQEVKGIGESQKKHDGFGERLVIVEQKSSAAHSRLDELIKRLEEESINVRRRR